MDAPIRRLDGRALFGRGAAALAASELAARGAERVLIVATPTRRSGADTLAAALGDRCVGVLAVARSQVPAEVAAEAVGRAREVAADWVVAHGGGTAIGLAKAVALQVDVAIGAVVTTYAGSEMTNIYGITANGVKTTGRDDRVRPSLVVYDPELVDGLPQAIATASVVNALAHAVEALYAPGVEETLMDEAEAAAATLFRALTRLDSALGREQALFGAHLAGKVLDAAAMGAQHKLAHTLGGSFGVPHHAAHSVLLPHVVAANLPKAPAALRRLQRAFGSDDPAASLWDAAKSVGVPTRLRDFGFDESHVDAAVALALTKRYPNPRPLAAQWLRPLLYDAVGGRRPGVQRRTLAIDSARAEGVHARLRAVRAGAPLHRARGAVILLHGRNGTAEDLVQRVLRHSRPARLGVTLIAPQASGNTWYPRGFKDEAANRATRTSAWSVVDALVAQVTEHVPLEHVVVAGFSQGACLALSWLARKASRAPGGVAALLGALEPEAARLPDVTSLRAVITGSRTDSWMQVEDLERSAQTLRAHGARVTLDLRAGPHRLEPSDFQHLTHLMETVVEGNDLKYLSGFGAHHQSEAIPGTLPRQQSTPRKVAHGLYPEGINGTGFTVERAQNRVTWVYRVRPQLYLAPWERLDGGQFVGDFSEGVLSPELLRYRPMAYPAGDVDFVRGITTFAGAGDPSMRTGMAIHCFRMTAGMEGKAFVNLDGDMLLVPQDGAIRVRSELGWLHASPGHLVILPRGLRYQVMPADGKARGWIAELFSGHFQLPERGLIGANGLASERHFLAPVASFENTDATYEVIQKQGGALWRNPKAVSPFDVVAWHGTYAPFVYDLDNFMAYGSVTFDHPDPSVLTVLTSPLDTHGRNVVDVAVFKGRWDATEHTFRPPYFHRNSAIEFNAVVKSPSNTGPYQAGAITYTPYLMPHGVSARNYRRNIGLSDEAADRPMRLSDDELWVQFESTFPLRVMPWMFDHPDRDHGYLAQFDGFEPAEV